ncbi:MAG: hypothetical protein H6579_03755 [Chitinophagales bacterium]|nr:hypothetical protein [Chitinophagales bacterium]
MLTELVTLVLNDIPVINGAHSRGGSGETDQLNDDTIHFDGKLLMMNGNSVSRTGRLDRSDKEF